MRTNHVHAVPLPPPPDAPPPPAFASSGRWGQARGHKDASAHPQKLVPIFDVSHFQLEDAGNRSLAARQMQKKCFKFVCTSRSSAQAEAMGQQQRITGAAAA